MKKAYKELHDKKLALEKEIVDSKTKTKSLQDSILEKDLLCNNLKEEINKIEKEITDAKTKTASSLGELSLKMEQEISKVTKTNNELKQQEKELMEKLAMNEKEIIEIKNTFTDNINGLTQELNSTKQKIKDLEKGNAEIEELKTKEKLPIESNINKNK